MSKHRSQRQGENPQELSFTRGNTEISELPALGLTLGSTFGVTEGQRRSRISDTEVANNWELPGVGEGEESSEGELDIQDDWEERINLVCTEYGLTKPHRQAQYQERAIKIVDEFAGNEPDKLARGSSKY